MGDSLSNCCTPLQNHSQFNRQIVIQEGSNGFDQTLKQFFNKYPRMNDLYQKKWSYCHKVDKTKITTKPDCIFIGDNSTVKHEAIILYNNGFLYEGQVQEKLRQGLGRLISSEGDCYEGKWHSNQPHGQGIYEGLNPKRKYRGLWQEGFLVGRGKATYDDGSHYQGEFHMNLRHGKGTIKYPDGSVYQGDFKNNLIQGFGTLIGLNHKYQGSWRNGKMDGAGKSSWFSPDDQLLQTYEGQYQNGLKHGKGQYRWSNGRVYKGEWYQGQIVKNKLQKAK